jgi:hypothetical protein
VPIPASLVVRTPCGDVELSVTEPDHMSQITWRTTVAHQSTEDMQGGSMQGGSMP